MSFLRQLVRSAVSKTVAPTMRFPEENLLATVSEGDGFFVTSPGAVLKGGRYKIVRKLGRGACSSTFLVEDLQPKSSSSKYLAAKILTVASTAALEQGIINELEFLQAVAQRRESTPVPSLPDLEDHFAQRGPHGIHYCLLTALLRTHVHAFRSSAPLGKLAVHVVKPIIACVVEGLGVLHSLNIIHADVKADNVLFLGPDTAEVEETIAKEPPLTDGTFEFQGTQYPILRSQPFPPKISWDVSAFVAETTQVVLGDLGAALWADKPKPPGDIGAFALRAPENIVRAECGKQIDIWAIGCMTYELLTGQILFRPQPTADLTADESLLLLQYALTGETLDNSLVEQSRARDQYFDSEGKFVKAKANPYPRQTLKELLAGHTELNAIQVDAAARFIGDCLRLNPGDRMSTDQLEQHRWLETAFMGGMDDLEQPAL